MPQICTRRVSTSMTKSTKVRTRPVSVSTSTEKKSTAQMAPACALRKVFHGIRLRRSGAGCMPWSSRVASRRYTSPEPSRHCGHCVAARAPVGSPTWWILVLVKHDDDTVGRRSPRERPGWQSSDQHGECRDERGRAQAVESNERGGSTSAAAESWHWRCERRNRARSHHDRR
jgi:hypothetical protein